MTQPATSSPDESLIDVTSADVPAAEEFHRVHPLTPLLRFWTLFLAILAAAVLNAGADTAQRVWDFVRGEHEIALWSVLGSLGGVIVVCLVIWLISRVWWKATGYRVTTEEVQLRRGVFQASLRSARLDRVQAVDIVESVIARIFGVAALRIEVAGGSNSVIEIAFLKKQGAEQLRAEIVRATRHSPHTEHEELALAESNPEILRGEVIIPEIPIARSLLSAFLTGMSATLIIGVPLLLLSPLGFAGALPLLLALAPQAWDVIDRSWKFRAELHDEVLQVNFGLADRRRQSIPLQRIHAVSMRQPVLWRLFGWWTVSASVVGYGGLNAKESGTTKILPVGSKEQALRVLEIVSSLDAAEIAAHADPEHPGDFSFHSPARAKWISPIDLKQQGVTIVGEPPRVAIVHSGRLVRTVKAVDISHIQELTLRRGPLHRPLDLAEVRFDLVPGPVVMVAADLSYSDSKALLDILRRRQLPELTPEEIEP